MELRNTPISSGSTFSLCFFLSPQKKKNTTSILLKNKPNIAAFAHFSPKLYEEKCSPGAAAPTMRHVRGHTLHGWPCVHLYPWLKCMCPAAAVSCIIHDVSGFSAGWCLSVSITRPLSLSIHSPWMVMTTYRVCTQTVAGKKKKAIIKNKKIYKGDA